MTTRLRAGEVGEIAFVLPLPPGINTTHIRGERVPGQYRYVQTSSGARPVLSNYAKQWCERAEMVVQVAIRQQGWADPGGDLEITLRQQGTGRDTDAGSKLCLDAVASGLGVNDARFKRVVMERDKAGAPCLAVTVRPLERAEAQ